MRPSTEGQRLLLDAPESLAVIAKAVGASKQAVSYWRRGDKLPGDSAREALRVTYGIPVDAWDRAPGGVSDRPSPPADRPPRPPSDRSGALQSPIEIAEEQLRMLLELQQESDDHSPAVRLKLASEINRTNEKRASLLDKTRSLSRQFWESHEGVAFREGALSILADYPEAEERFLDLCDRMLGAGQ